MFCNKCGNKLDDDSIFCNKCGNKIDNVNVESTTPKTDNVQKIEPTTPKADNVQNEQTVEVEPSKKPKKQGKIGLIVGIVVLALVAVLFVGIKVVPNLNSKTELTETFEDKENGFSFNYPKNWKEEDNKRDDDLISLENKSTNMVVTKSNLESDGAIFVDSKEDMEEIYKDYDIELINLTDEKIDGVDAKKVYSSPETSNVETIAYFYSIDDDVYIIKFTSENKNFEKNELLFDEIMGSYKITREPSEDSKVSDDEDTKVSSIKDNIGPDGLTEAQALEVAQEFLDTHPLYQRTITGEVQYEPFYENLSTKGLYKIGLKTSDGSPRAMYVQKSNGDTFMLSIDGTKFITGEELYNEVYLSVERDTIVFSGKSVGNYLGKKTDVLNTDFGTPLAGTAIDGSYFFDMPYTAYDSIAFMYDENTSIIKYIGGIPALFTYNGFMLDNNRDELVKLLGKPISENYVQNQSGGPDIYELIFNIDNYSVAFRLADKDSDAYEIVIYQ